MRVPATSECLVIPEFAEGEYPGPRATNVVLGPGYLLTQIPG
jgi:hypothetical protein